MQNQEEVDVGKTNYGTVVTELGHGRVARVDLRELGAEQGRRVGGAVPRM